MHNSLDADVFNGVTVRVMAKETSLDMAMPVHTVRCSQTEMYKDYLDSSAGGDENGSAIMALCAT